MTTETIPLPHFHSGKVRDTYEIPDHPDKLLMVASDRISTHNVKHLSLIPSKGALLNAQTIFWDTELRGQIATHILEIGKGIFRFLPSGDYPEDLHHRAVVVRRYKPDLREFIWRQFLTGSLEKAYRAGTDPYGLVLPRGLVKMSRFERPIFTPTMKSENDEPVRTRFVRRQYPDGTQLTGYVFEWMSCYLEKRGVTLIDGKFEVAGNVLIDEWGTGDCCRMAWTKDIQEGFDPPWLDKEHFRQAAERAWDGGPKVPLTFDATTIEEGVRKYHQAFEAITETPLAIFQHEFLN